MALLMTAAIISLLYSAVMSQLKPGNTNLCNTNDVPYQNPFSSGYLRCGLTNSLCPTGYYCTTGYCCPQPGQTCPGNVQPMMSNVNSRPMPCSSTALCPTSHYCWAGVCCPTIRTRCTLPKQEGSCTSYSQRWWYNPRLRTCQQFLYTGCQGNSNNFPSLNDCLAYCNSQIGTPTQVQIEYPNIINLNSGLCPAGDSLRTLTGVEIRCATSGDCKAPQTHFCYGGRCCPNRAYACSLPKDSGTCTNLVPRFYFDDALRSCQPFTWKGCGGNANRFALASECEQYCTNNVIPSPPQNPIVQTNSILQSIAQSVFPSSCRIGYPQKESSGAALSCSSLNRCNNQTHQCINGWCCPRTDYVCAQPMVEGSCAQSLYIRRWYHNSLARPHRCDSFIYNGCNGNDNSFSTKSECQAFCMGGPISNGIVSNSLLINNNLNFVTQQPGTSNGRCPGNDELNLHRRCFMDDDCNRLMMEECYGGICCPSRNMLCGFPKQRGTCQGGDTERWWYNRFNKRCESFMFSGCFGNSNNFRTRSNCENVCRGANTIPF